MEHRHSKLLLIFSRGKTECSVSFGDRKSILPEKIKCFCFLDLQFEKWTFNVLFLSRTTNTHGRYFNLFPSIFLTHTRTQGHKHTHTDTYTHTRTDTHRHTQTSIQNIVFCMHILNLFHLSLQHIKITHIT